MRELSLDREDFLMPSSGSNLRRSLEGWFERLGIQPRVVAEFEDRAMSREDFLVQSNDYEDELLGADGQPIPAGPREAIRTYQKILDTYPDYERNDKVLYQMSRAYDEIGQPDKAMEVTNRLVREYPHSQHVDEVQFRRGEYYFVRKRWQSAEQAGHDPHKHDKQHGLSWPHLLSWSS